MHTVTPRALALTTTLSALAFSPPAAADPLPVTPPRFALDASVGYAAPFTTGLSPYGAFASVGARVRVVRRLWVSVAAWVFVGSRASGDGTGVSYHAHNRAVALSLDATWRFEVGRVSIEPGMEFGAALITGSTEVQSRVATDRYVHGNLGPVVRLAVRVRRWAFGVEGAALFVPAYVAAPILRAGAVAELSF